MKTELTPEQIETYRRQGFLVLPDFLTPEELEEWRAAVTEAVAKRQGSRMPPPGAPDLPPSDAEAFYSNVFIQSINLWETNARVRRLVLDERLGRLACELEGSDGIRIWHDQAFIKRPWDNPTSWHLDNPYWSFTSAHATSMWLALDDATYQNGCLYFLPGTHRQARLDPARGVYVNAGIGPNMNEVFKAYPEWKSIPSVAAPMKAGTCSFHNGLTAHGAGANMTAGWRRAMTIPIMPDGSTFNGQRNVLPKEKFEALRIGDPLNDDSINPLVWSKHKR